MNAPVLLAQLSGSTQTGSTPPKTVRVEKPQNGQAVTVQLDGQTRVDFSAIASERITFVRVGHKLIVLFDNESTVTVDPVFDSAGNALPTVDFAMSGDRTLSATEFAAAFPITTDQSVLPAAGNAAGGPTGGANFRSATVNGLGDPNAPLDLLGNENFGASSLLNQDATANPVPFVINAVLNSTIIETTLTDSSNGFVTQTTGPVSLLIDWNGQPAGTVTFATSTLANMTALGLSSNGVALVYSLSTDGAVLSAFAGAGGPLVFTVALSGSGNGSYTFTLFDNLDHLGANGATLPLAFDVVATDAEGDTVDQQFTVVVTDDVPTAQAVGPQTLNESTASGGESGESNAFVTTSTGAVSLNIDWNSDDSNAGTNGIDRSVTFAAGTETAFVGLGLTSNGETITYTINGDRTLLTASVGERVIFTVSLSDLGNGSYTFTLSDNIDHQGANGANLPLTFNVTVRDADGDAINQPFTVIVTDDVPTVGSVGPRTLAESTSNGSEQPPFEGPFESESFSEDQNAFVEVSTGAVSLNIDWNSDDSNAGINGIDRSVAFAAGTEAAFAALGLTSNGETITYAINDDGTLLTASVGARVIFTVSLSDLGNGSYTFTLSDNIDHRGENGASLPLTFNVVATDADGDPVDQQFVVDVTDDVPTAGPVSGRTLIESTGSDETNAFIEVSTGAVSLNIDWNSDDSNADINGIGRSVAFAAGTEAALLALGLTSNGAPITYVVNGTLLTASVGEHVIFTISLSDAGNGSYTFTLSDNLDHLGQNGTTLPLTFNVVATDADGDPVDQQFVVNITDDVPQPVGKITTGVVGEDGLNPSNPNGGSFDGVNNASTGAVSLGIDWNSDDDVRGPGDDFGRTLAFLVGDTPVAAGPGSVSGIAVVDGQSGAELTSGGVALRYVVTSDANGGQLLTAYRGESNVQIFTLALDATASNGSYTFTLLGPLDHAGNSNSISLTFDVRATDADHDFIDREFVVTVDDDTPITTGAIAGQTVDEDGLTGGLAGDSYSPARPAPLGDAAGVALHATQSLNISWGSDNGDTGTDTTANGGRTLVQDAIGVGAGDRSVVFTAATLTALNAMNLSSNGQPVHYITNADGTLLIAYRGAAVGSIGDVNSSNMVFRVSLSDEANGSYSFELLRVLDHPGVDSEDDIDLTFGFQATDADGDTVTGSFLVTVDDDAPLIGTPGRGTVEEEEGAVAGAGIEDSIGLNDDDIVVLGAPVWNPLGREVQGTLAISWGADGGNSEPNGGASAGNGDRGVSFGGLSGNRVLTAAEANAFITVSGGVLASALTSRGEALSYTLSNDGGTLTATAGGSRLCCRIRPTAAAAATRSRCSTRWSIRRAMAPTARTRCR
jgi:T1SS-143 domain-containing protein